MRFSLKLVESFLEKKKNVSEEHRPLLTKLRTELIKQDEHTHLKTFGNRDFTVNIQGVCEYTLMIFISSVFLTQLFTANHISAM